MALPTWLVPRSGWRFLLRLCIYYGLIVAGVYLIQDRMLYAPTRVEPRQLAREAQARGYRLWPGAGVEYRGLLAEPLAGEVAGTVVVFHGNAGSAGDRSYFADALTLRGLRVLLAEYPGYGPRSGRLGEAALVPDALVTLEVLHREFGSPLYLFGESLGAGVSGAVAARTQVPIRGIVLVTPWDSLPALAQQKLWFLPARWLARDRYDSRRNLAGYPGPVALLRAEQDQIIPARRSLELHRSLPEPKRIWVFQGRDHNNWPAEVGAAWWDEVLEFLSRTDPSGA